MPFTVLDLIFCVILVVVCIRAAIEGFLKEVFGIGSFVIGGYAAFIFSPKLKPYLASSINDTLAAIFSFVLIFAVVFLVMKIIQKALEKVFEGSILKSLDHCLGFGFGIAEGIFVILIIFFILTVLKSWINTTQIIETSYFYKLLKGLVDSTNSLILENV